MEPQRGLLETIMRKIGCSYLSDLSCSVSLRQIGGVVEDMDPDGFSLPEWNDAVHYFTKKTAAFDSPRAAAEFLIAEGSAGGYRAGGHVPEREKI